MRRIRLTQFGPPDVLQLEEVVDPTPGTGQVLIDVDFAGVTFVETQVRAGRPPWSGPLPPTPYLPGNGVEGTISAVGSGVDSALVGTRVVTPTGGSGGYADRVVVNHAMVIAVPDGTPAGNAVALLADGRTALAVLRASRLAQDEVVLITAAAGGVGGLLVQLARTAGAGSVIALVGGQRKCEHARSLGADVTIDYREENWIERLKKTVESQGLNVVFDGVGGVAGRAVFDTAPPLSRFSVFGMASGFYTEASVRDIVLRGVTVVGGAQLRSPSESNTLSAAALVEAAEGRLKPVIGQIFPLERAADAHAAVEGRDVIGKTLLSC